MAGYPSPTEYYVVRLAGRIATIAAAVLPQTGDRAHERFQI